MTNNLSSSKVQDIAGKLFYHLRSLLPHPWSNTDPFYLSEAMVKPLPDEKINRNRFDNGRVPINAYYPFNLINRYVVKLLASPNKKREHIELYKYKQLNSFDSKEFIDLFYQDLIGDYCRNFQVNITEKRAKAFLKSLVFLSKELTFNYDAYHDESQLIRKSRFFLIGEPGTGKTSFLNYILSVYSQEILIPQHTIIIRVDLNDAIMQKSNFENLILKKFYWIYRSYFFENKIYVANNYELISFFKKKYNLSDDEKKEISKIERSITKMRSGAMNIDFSFIRTLMQYLTEKFKVSYIYIIDGLDYITLAEMHDKKFKSWLRQVDKYILTNKALRGSYVITMRNISFQKALESRSGSVLERWKEAKRLEVEKVGLDTIIESKLSYARAKIYKDIESKRKSKAPDYPLYAWITPNILNKITDEYLAYISLPHLGKNLQEIADIKSYSDLREYVITPGIELLDEISSGNFRCLFRNLNLILSYFIQSYGKDITELEAAFKKSIQHRLHILIGRTYLVIRTLIVGQREIHDYRTPYNYKLVKTVKNRITFFKQGTRFVIPPITNFVHVYSDNYLTQFRGLFKIRLLQFLANTKRPHSIKYITKFFIENFGYESSLHIKADIEEMLYNQLIKPSNLFAYFNKEDCNICITEAGKIILEKFLYWYVYFETTVDSLPMPQSLADNIKPMNYYWEINTDQNRYVLSKAEAIIIYLNYLSYVEVKEKTKFNELQAEKNETDRIQYSLYFENIVSKIMSNVQQDIISTFSDRINKDKKRFLRMAYRKYNLELNF
jgi:hypothetical protein